MSCPHAITHKHVHPSERLILLHHWSRCIVLKVHRFVYPLLYTLHFITSVILLLYVYIYTRYINNGLPQGSVLAPILFNLYTSDLPNTISKMFIYADDICVVCKKKQLNDCETTLDKDLKTLGAYFKQWRLRPNPDKTESSLFRLNNKSAYHSLNTNFFGNSVPHNPFPKYLGVALDRTLTYKTHLTNIAAKIGSRNNII